ncbi:MAG: isochorismatase family protein [Candidatus Gastranaerophilales bacterium]|nr:isochorismatase family protein [Candidatus Gastranaerophilales bacterium]
MLDCQNISVICIDLQEKLVNMLLNSDLIAQNATKLMNAAHILNINTLITEQYPKGLGSTIESIKAITSFKTIEKTSFSALEVLPELKKDIVIFGIETHICVYQTVLDLLKKGHNVYVVADCCASRSELNYKTSLELMKQFGAKITTLEIVLFELLKTSKHPNFKEIQSLIK